jgi:hypothetical protein
MLGRNCYLCLVPLGLESALRCVNTNVRMEPACSATRGDYLWYLCFWLLLEEQHFHASAFRLISGVGGIK